MRNAIYLCISIAALAITGCGQDKPASGPVAGTVNLEGLTTEQKIEKIRNDNTIPEQYKETYINSLKAQSGQK